MPSSSPPRKWYYDANALEGESVFREIINLRKNHATVAVTSHLGLGEAFGNCRRKNVEKLKAFNELIVALGDNLQVVGNDEVQEIYDDLRTEFPTISETDRWHLATAIKNNCVQFHTADRGIIGLSVKKIRAIAYRYSCENFTIKETNF